MKHGSLDRKHTNKEVRHYGTDRNVTVTNITRQKK